MAPRPKCSNPWRNNGGLSWMRKTCTLLPLRKAREFTQVLSYSHTTQCRRRLIIAHCCFTECHCTCTVTLSSSLSAIVVLTGSLVLSLLGVPKLRVTRKISWDEVRLMCLSVQWTCLRRIHGENPLWDLGLSRPNYRVPVLYGPVNWEPAYSVPTFYGTRLQWAPIEYTLTLELYVTRTRLLTYRGSVQQFLISASLKCFIKNKEKEKRKENLSVGFKKSQVIIPKRQLKKRIISGCCFEYIMIQQTVRRIIYG